MNVLITGATGFIGKHLVPCLLDKAYSVACLARPSSRKPVSFSQKVSWKLGDLNDPDSLKRACQKMDTVIHLAGIVKAGSPEDYFTVNHTGMINLYKAINPATKLVFISSQAALGPTAPASPLAEDATPQPVSEYGRSKLAAERVITDNPLPINYTIIRPPIVYGPEDQESLSIFKLARLHLRPQIGLKKSLVNAVFVQDLVTFIENCLHNRNADRQIFHINDGNDMGYSYPTIIRTAACALNTWTAPLLIPKTALKILASANAYIADLRGRTSMFNPDKYKELTARGWLLSTNKAKSLLGYRAVYSLADGFQKSADWYRSMGWL